MNAEEEGRFQALETKSAYQEAEIAELGALALEQGKRIDALERKLEKIAGKVRDLGEKGPALSKNERPPHY